MIPAVNVRVHDAYVTGEGLLQSVLGAYRRAPVSWNAYRSKSHAVTSPHIRYKYSAQKPSKSTACKSLIHTAAAALANAAQRLEVF